MKRIICLLLLSILVLPACQKKESVPDLMMPDSGPDLENIRPLTPPQAN